VPITWAAASRMRSRLLIALFPPAACLRPAWPSRRAARLRTESRPRRPAAFAYPGELTVVTADVMTAEDLRPAIRGRDVVITTLGPGSRSPEPVATPALDALVSAMWAENASRVVLVSNSGMHSQGDPVRPRSGEHRLLTRAQRTSSAQTRQSSSTP
jgi:hypothetical protein